MIFQILVSTVESVHLILYREIFITLILSKASVIQQKNWCLWCDEDLKLARNLVKLYSTDKENIGRKIIFTIYFTWYVVIFIMLFVVLYFHMYATCICIIVNDLINKFKLKKRNYLSIRLGFGFFLVRRGRVIISKSLRKQRIIRTTFFINFRNYSELKLSIFH